jgi:hypothetical protein
VALDISFCAGIIDDYCEKPENKVVISVVELFDGQNEVEDVSRLAPVVSNAIRYLGGLRSPYFRRNAILCHRSGGRFEVKLASDRRDDSAQRLVKDIFRCRLR